MPVSRRKGRSLDRIKQAIDPQPDQPINIGVIDIFDRLVFRRDAVVHKHPGAPAGSMPLSCHSDALTAIRAGAALDSPGGTSDPGVDPSIINRDDSGFRE